MLAKFINGSTFSPFPEIQGFGHFCRFYIHVLIVESCAKNDGSGGTSTSLDQQLMFGQQKKVAQKSRKI